ncbi:MAG TPA: pseudouridine synthase [Candidatus Hypogeohydataceae bacterium YC41]
MMIRLQKLLAEAGFGSRRECERLIANGYVAVDGNIVTEMGRLADPQSQIVECKGVRVKVQPKVYYLLNKPKGYVCTNLDELDRPRAIDLIPGIAQRVYCVGRLDVDSEGLIILTNDGEFTNFLTHPRYGVAKTYLVELNARIKEEDLEKLRKGVWLSGGKTAPARVKVLRRGSNNTWLEITLKEGRNREVRRILVRLGYKVRILRRIRIGWLEDPRLKTGRFRRLASGEVARFYSTTKGKKRGQGLGVSDQQSSFSNPYPLAPKP